MLNKITEFSSTKLLTGIVLTAVFYFLSRATVTACIYPCEPTVPSLISQYTPTAFFLLAIITGIYSVVLIIIRITKKLS